MLRGLDPWFACSRFQQPPLRFCARLSRPHSIVLVAVILITAVHMPFFIADHFGEQDAARIANDSIRAFYKRRFEDLEAMIHSTPLYLDVLRKCLETGFLSIAQIPLGMSLTSLIANAITTASLLVFLLRATGSLSLSLGASTLLQLTPIYWLSSLYGFPTIVALALFVASLVPFQSALTIGSRRFRWPFLLSAATLYMLAVMTKVDVLLASAIFGWPGWQTQPSCRARMIAIGCLTLFAGFAFSVFNQYGNHLAAYETATIRWMGWFSRFFSGLDSVVTLYDAKVIAHAVGILSVPTAILGVLLVGRQPRWKASVLWLALAGLPLVLF
jgi:hypothetical protein